MTPAGYLLKRIVPPPAWLDAPGVEEVCSVTACVNDDVVDVASAWRHNGYGLANDVEELRASAADLDTAEADLFFYTAYSRELESDGHSFAADDWRPRRPVPSAGVADAVRPPPGWPAIDALGFDVVVRGDYLEHSPLSCNGVAKEIPVNRYALFDTLADAVAAIERGAFVGCEPGVYTVYGVYRLAAAT